MYVCVRHHIETRKLLPNYFINILKNVNDTPEGIVKMVQLMKKPNQKMIEGFRDINDIRYGTIGTTTENPANKWIKVATVKLNGANVAKGMTMELYPSTINANSKQTIIALLNNSTNNLEEPYVAMIKSNGTMPFIKDVKLVKTSGTGINNNIVEIWIQLNSNNSTEISVMYYLYKYDVEDIVAITPQPAQDALPNGQSFSVSEIFEPNIFKNQLIVKSEGNGDMIHLESKSNNYYHRWSQFHVPMSVTNKGNDYWFMETASDSTGKMCNEAGVGADVICPKPRFVVQSKTGNVGIGTEIPTARLHINDGGLRIGNWLIQEEGDNLKFTNTLKSQGKSIALYSGQNVTIQESPQVSVSGKPVFVLGDFGMQPWGNNPSFPDRAAKWIWGEFEGHKNSTNNRYTFMKTISNPTNAPITATLHLMVDNDSQVYLNDTLVGNAAGGWSSGANYPKVNITIPSGNHLLKILAYNQGGPAGFLGSITVAGVTYRTDASWTFV